MNSRERVLTLLAGGEPDCLPSMPITMMFAADHAGTPYRQYATDYRSLAEAQMLVARDFDLDYVNTMSDPAVEASDCGATIRYFDNQPPAVDESMALLLDTSRLNTLECPDPINSPRMRNRILAVEKMHREIGSDKIVEGWVEGPCAEASDLRGINNLMTDFYDAPEFVERLFEFILAMEIKFAAEQVKAGADIIGIGDAAASLVGPRIYEQYVWPFEKRLVDAIHAMGVKTRLHICGNTRKIAGGMGRLGCNIVDLDFLTPIAGARAEMGPTQVISGNMDPVRTVRDGSPESIFEALAQCQRDAGRAFLVAPGCETPRDTPIENFRAITAYAHTHGPLN